MIVLWWVGLLLMPFPLGAQVATSGPDTVVPMPQDLGDVRRRAMSAQAAFERTRVRHVPLRFGSSALECDEYVGRLCTTYEEGEWYPQPDAEEIVEARARLLEDLDSLQLAAPGDGWILGQRIWYRADGGDWSGALRAAQTCGPVDTWWCAALEGLALHGLGRFEEAEAVFDAALDGMDPAAALAWRVPERAVDRATRSTLREWMADEPGRLEERLDAFWTLADPLYLVGGNDRLTAHYARWTVSEIKREARNPYGLSWADDLEELTVRNGWELGYERARAPIGRGRDAVTGHKHPEARDFLPGRRLLLEPLAAEEGDWSAHRRRPRSLYAPRYAPVLLPMQAQIHVFRRATTGVVLATGYLPEDTSFHAGHTHALPWMEPGDQEGMPDRRGLFAVPLGGAGPAASAAEDGVEGALLLELPLGAYVVSSESWSPSRRRAGRFRRALVIEPPTADVPSASDILLLRGGAPAPMSLEEALPRVLPRARTEIGEPLGIAWEVAGLGFRSETLEYEVSVERTDRGVLSRLGDFLGLSERPRPLALSWQEPGPERPGTRFRYLDLDLPVVDPGEYEITLTLRSEGRSDVVATKSFQVVDP